MRLAAPAERRPEGIAASPDDGNLRDGAVSTPAPIPLLGRFAHRAALRARQADRRWPMWPRHDLGSADGLLVAAARRRDGIDFPGDRRGIRASRGRAGFVERALHREPAFWGGGASAEKP